MSLSYLLKAKPTATATGFVALVLPMLPAHHITSRLHSRVPQSLWRSSATTGVRAPLSPLSPLLAGGGLSLWWGHEQVFSRVYGVGSRGHRCILVTAVTVMTLMTLIFGLILDRGRTSTSLGHYPFSLTRRTRRGEQAAPYLCDL